MEYSLLDNKICLKTSIGKEVFIYSNISSFSIFKNHVEVIFKYGNKIRVLYSLKELEIRLSKLMFYRCRANCLVNLNQISKYIHKTGELYLSNGSILVVAKDRRCDFNNMLTSRLLL